MISGLLGRPPAAALAAQIHARSGGIPFYIEELVASAEDRSTLPATVRDAVQVRLGQLSESAYGLMRNVAVLGNRVPHDMLVAVAGAGEESLEPDLRDAIDVGVLLVDGDGYAFRHALLREAVEAELLPSERSRLHRQAAATLEAAPDLLGRESAAHAIALHWAAGRDNDKAFAWSIRAARSGSAAHFESLQMYERVLELWDLVDEPTRPPASTPLCSKRPPARPRTPATTSGRSSWPPAHWRRRGARTIRAGSPGWSCTCTC